MPIDALEDLVERCLDDRVDHDEDPPTWRERHRSRTCSECGGILGGHSAGCPEAGS
jgi:hypothetical protein